MVDPQRTWLKKEKILKKADDFSLLFKAGNRINSRHFLILSAGSHRSMIGFAASKRIDGAVRRNKAKRRLRELYRLNQQLFPLKRRIVMVAKIGTERRPFALLNLELVRLIKDIR